MNMKKWEKAALRAHKQLSQDALDWKNFDDEEKHIAVSQYYDLVFRHAKGNKDARTGLISAEAMELSKPTYDHWLSPRMVARAILDDNHWVLEEKDYFVYDVFKLSQSQIALSSEQNNLVKFNNSNGEIFVKELTKDKYLKFKFWDKKKEGGAHWVDDNNPFPLVNKIPEWFTEYEKKFYVGLDK
tara:strand:- start:57 stop:611 length:555 start_codon:yes stop_codon:yes gene_type:complete